VTSGSIVDAFTRFSSVTSNAAFGPSLWPTASCPDRFGHFDPTTFRRSISASSPQGLAITRSVIVSKYGRTIHFKTDEGRGTAFIICLPREGKTLTAQSASA
jgi:hypothetical protein